MRALMQKTHLKNPTAAYVDVLYVAKLSSVVASLCVLARASHSSYANFSASAAQLSVVRDSYITMHQLDSRTAHCSISDLDWKYISQVFLYHPAVLYS